jgi:cytochrome c oxidase assembly protein subunit 15
LFFAARKQFPKGHLVRRWAAWSLVFTISEALLGAKLVLFGLVSSNDTPYRALVMAMHLINSVMLTGSLALTADLAGFKTWVRKTQSPWTFEGLKPVRISTGLVVSFGLIGLTGAIAALAGTLFPAQSLAEGFRADWDPNSHFLVRLRGLHPLLGILFGGSMALTAWLSIQLQKPEETELRRRSKIFAGITASTVAIGILTLLTLSPTALKLIHLTFAHAVWIALVLWIREVLWKGSNNLT